MEHGGDGAKKRTHLTLQQKAQLRAFLAANPNLPQFAVADWVREQFHVRLGRTTLYRIQNAPEGSFTTGNLSRKKLRRVKFPEFERQLLDFYQEKRSRREDVPDDALLLKAAECRAACGIADTELKLSNGWLYRFKTRHQLTNVLTQSVKCPEPNNTAEESDRDIVAITMQEPSALGIESGGQESENGAPAMSDIVCEAGVLSARALTTVQGPRAFNWEPVGDIQLDEFAVIADGVLVQQPGVYELSVQVHHSAPLADTPCECIFKVYCDDRVVGQCYAPAHVQNDVGCSVWVDSDLMLDAQTLLKIEFLAPGYAFTDSTLVLRQKIQ